MLWCRKDRVPDTNWSWVVCISATLNNLLQFGFSQSFGVFLPVLSDHFNVGREKTAWAGSLAIGFTLFSGPIAVKLTQQFGHRIVAIVSGLGCAISLITSSFANHVIVLYFSYGLVFGLSAGNIINTGYTITTKYFKKNRALATGITASGISIGVMVIGPITEKLVEVLGWRDTFRVVAGLMLLICLFSSTYDPIKVDSGQVQTLNQRGKMCLYIFDCTLFTNGPYTIGLIAIFLSFLGFFVPIIHLVRFAKDLDISSKDASFLFIYIGITSTASRIVIGQVIDKKWLTPLQVVQLFSFILGMSILFFALAKQYSHFVIFSVGYGIANGGFITSQNVFLQSILDPEKSAIALGMGYMVCSIAVCAGSPFAGFLADKLGSYIVSFYVIGGVMVFSAFLPFLLQCPWLKQEGIRLEKVEIVLNENNGIQENDVLYVSSLKHVNNDV